MERQAAGSATVGAGMGIDHVLFDDNDQVQLTWDKIRPLDLEVGERVFCRVQAGPAYHPGEIVRQKGERLFIRYDDGHLLFYHGR